MADPDGSEQSADAMILLQMASGDRDALGTLYDRHIHAVYRFLLSRSQSVQDSEDLVQDVFLTAWRRAGAIRIVDASALPWLLVTAKYLLANRIRARRDIDIDIDDLDLHQEPDDLDPVATELERRALRGAIETAVGALSSADQAVYRLCIDDDCTYEEAAAILGTSHGAVRNRLSNARKNLRRDLMSHQVRVRKEK